LRTSKEKIVALESEKKKIDKEYTKTVIERNIVMDDYDKKLRAMGDKFKEINAKILSLNPPIPEVKQ